ncbi:MAG: hypothetical protein HY673_15870 [Chloroflexi bacterium]|nr:hypothetical protein [Chloroflexota bacterium]
MTGKKDETVFLFPDCQDKELWAAFLGSAGLVPLARCLFIVDRDPADWRAAMSRLFEIAQGIAQGKSATEYEADMSVCHCLCYSLDEDLVIAKVALPERTVLSVLEGAAREEGLELVVRRKP